MAGFATDIGDNLPKMPSILGKPEAEYYKLRSKPPDPPPRGKILLQRTPHTKIIKVTLPNGESHRMIYSRDTAETLVRDFDVPREKISGIIDYLWNMYTVYVAQASFIPAEPEVPPSPFL